MFPRQRVQPETNRLQGHWHTMGLARWKYLEMILDKKMTWKAQVKRRKSNLNLHDKEDRLQYDCRPHDTVRGKSNELTKEQKLTTINTSTRRSRWPTGRHNTLQKVKAHDRRPAVRLTSMCGPERVNTTPQRFERPWVNRIAWDRARATDRDSGGRVNRVVRPAGPTSAVLDDWASSRQSESVQFEHLQVNRVAWGIGWVDGEHRVRAVLGGSSSLRPYGLKGSDTLRVGTNDQKLINGRLHKITGQISDHIALLLRDGKTIFQLDHIANQIKVKDRS